MFDLGWSEMLVIAIVLIVVVGPRDLPRMLRQVGGMTAHLRRMAGDFKKQFNEALKEAELDEVKQSVDSLRSLNPAAEIKKQLNPLEKAAADVRAGLDKALKPTPAKPMEGQSSGTAGSDKGLSQASAGSDRGTAAGAGVAAGQGKSSAAQAAGKKAAGSASAGSAGPGKGTSARPAKGAAPKVSARSAKAGSKPSEAEPGGAGKSVGRAASQTGKGTK